MHNDTHDLFFWLLIAVIGIPALLTMCFFTISEVVDSFWKMWHKIKTASARAERKLLEEEKDQ